MLATIPDELIIGGFSLLITSIVGSGIAIAKLHGRLSKLEETERLRELWKNGKKEEK